MKAKTKKELLRVTKFTLFSASAGAIQILVTQLLFLALDYWLAYLIGLVVSAAWNFVFNHKYTFRSAKSVPLAVIHIILFYVVFTPLSTILGHYVTEHGANETLVLVVTMVLNFVLKFLYSRFIIYHNAVDSAMTVISIISS